MPAIRLELRGAYGARLRPCFLVRCERLCGVVKQSGEDQHRLFVRRQSRPIGKPLKLGADHLRVGPNIAFGVPPDILLAVGHRSTPTIARRRIRQAVRSISPIRIRPAWWTSTLYRHLAVRPGRSGRSSSFRSQIRTNETM